MSTETANKGLEGVVALSSSVSSIVDGVFDLSQLRYRRSGREYYL
jgi:hypothetical protein